jgi:hypothetical protein
MAEKYDFTGVWQSTYRVRSGPEKKPTEVQHYMVMHRKGNQLVTESIPNPEGSYLVARFTLDGRIATGSYHSNNAPRSAAKDAAYYGAAQLILDKDGRKLTGKGVGFGKDMVVKESDWELKYVGKEYESTELTEATHWSAQASKYLEKVGKNK